jgi:hypothetical protein
LNLKCDILVSNFTAFNGVNLCCYSLARTHHDAVHRAYALTALDASAARVNKGIAALAGEDTHADSWELLQHASSPVHALMKEYKAVVELWRKVVEAMGKLDFAEAVKHVDALESAADAFARLAGTVQGEMHPVRGCIQSTQVEASALTLSWRARLATQPPNPCTYACEAGC